MVECTARPADTGRREALADLPSDAGAHQNLQEVQPGDWLEARKPRAVQSPHESGREPWRPAHTGTAPPPEPSARARPSAQRLKLRALA